MALPLALRVVGLLVVGYLLLVSLLAMGPIGWVVFVPLLAIGAAKVYRNRTRRGNRTRRDDGDRAPPNYCPNCGSAIDTAGFEGEEGEDGREGEYGGDDEQGENDEQRWKVRYCSDCGAPLRSDGNAGRSDEPLQTGRADGATNCPDCGAPNDPDRTTCEYCDANL